MSLNKNSTIILFCIVLLITICFAEESPWNPGYIWKSPVEVKELPRPSKLESTEDLKDFLNKSATTVKSVIDARSLDLFNQAHQKIIIVSPIINKKPDSDKARSAFSACSLVTEAAFSQLEAHYYRVLIEMFNREIIECLKNINSAHEQINDIERSQASNIKKQLESEKDKLLADLAAEKEKADKMRQEADQKFGELQSSLIQVSNDARGTIISMSDILFEIGKANLTVDLKMSLAKIAGILLVFKTSNVVVEGHTDNLGSEEYNLELSKKRAENVMNYLIEQGLDLSRLTALGFGFSQPIADNSTKKGRQKNRRVDLIVMEKKTLE